MGIGSPIHWFLIAIVLVLVFGNRLPSVMRSLGQGVIEFKKGVQGIENDVKSPINQIAERPSSTQTEGEQKASDVKPAEQG